MTLPRIVPRVIAGVWRDGFIHAGNLAYTAIVALFPFFITVTAIFSAIGERDQRAASINAVLGAVPPIVASALEPVAHDVIEARTGRLLWIGGLLGLWTVTSLIETIRDILYRAYGVENRRSFWRHRLFSAALIVVAVVALLFSLLAQVAIGGALGAIHVWVPALDPSPVQATFARLVPTAMLYGSLWLLFYWLTPDTYLHTVARKTHSHAIEHTVAPPIWPGALLVTIWWMAVSIALPWLLSSLLTYNLTYGSLAGVMISLFFFWLVGLGMVAGAELNAALATDGQAGGPKGAAPRT